jgi:hypothetical protein
MTALGQLKQSYLYWLWFLVEVIRRLRLVGQKLDQIKHAVRCKVDEENDMT